MSSSSSQPVQQRVAWAWWPWAKAALAEPVRMDLEDGTWYDDECSTGLQRGKKTASPVDVLELRCDGSKNVYTMRLRELMHRVAVAVDDETEVRAPSPSQLSAPVLVEARPAAPKKSKSSSKLDASEMSSPHPMRSLHSRDLRSMDPAYTLKAAHPGIAVRRHVVLANFDPMRAVILHDRLLVLLPKLGSEELVEDLCHHLRLASVGSRDDDDIADKRKVPFELTALEAVLAVATGRLATDCDQRLSPRSTQLIELLSKSRMSLEHLEKIRKLKNEVSYQEARARDTVEAIEAALDSDEDMCLMRLSQLKVEPALFEPPLSPDMLTQHEDVEDLLENYLQHVTATQTRLELLRLGIENAVDLFNMKLDVARNRLITADTIFNLVAMCLAAAAVVGGFYGMNLDLEGRSFLHVTAITTALCLVAGLFVFALLYRAHILLF